MKCPSLEKWVILNQCHASWSQGSGKSSYYIPSIFQMEEYCKTRNHQKCPLYLDFISKTSEEFAVV